MHCFDVGGKILHLVHLFQIFVSFKQLRSHLLFRLSYFLENHAIVLSEFNLGRVVPIVDATINSWKFSLGKVAPIVDATKGTWKFDLGRNVSIFGVSRGTFKFTLVFGRLLFNTIDRQSLTRLTGSL